MISVGCGYRSFQPANSPERDENAGITFVQWSDPHLFDGGATRRGQEIEEEKLDNWSALHWAVLQTNRLLNVDHLNIDFVVLTGDFGLYNVQMPKSDSKKGGSNKKGPIENDGKCSRDPKEGPGPAIPFDEAVQLVAQEFRALLVKKVYLVPGNNDLCDEDPRNHHRYAAFVSALQQAMQEQQSERKADLRAAKSAIQTQTPSSKLPPVDPPTVPEIVDLTFTMENFPPVQDEGPPSGNIAKAAKKTGSQQSKSPNPTKCSEAAGDFPLIKGFCLLGLDSSYFKAHDQKDVQDAADKASIDAMDRLNNQVERGGSYLLFTHTPDIEDPPPGGRKADPGSAWLLPGKARNIWKDVLNRNELIAVFAGHFHSRDRKIYPHNFSYVKSLDPVVAQKFWLAPPLSAKYQTDPPEAGTARGIVLFQVTNKVVAAKAQPGETVAGLPIWFSALDPNPTLSLEFYRQLALGKMYEQAGQKTNAEGAYRKALDAAAGEQRDVALRHLERVVNSWAFYELWMQNRRGATALLAMVCGILVVWVFWRRKRRLQIYPLEAPNDAKIPGAHLEQVTEYLVGVMRYRDAKVGPIGITKLPYVWSGFSKDLGTALENLVPGKSSGFIKLLLEWFFKPEFTLRGTLATGTPDSFIVLTLSRRGKPHTWEKSVPPGQAHDVLKDMVYAVLLHIKSQSS
jgi:hypothetical protein